MKATRHYSNTEKAALILLSMGKELASEVLKHLSEQEIKRISRAFMGVSQVPREDQYILSYEFNKMLMAGEVLLLDGREFAKDVITDAFGDSADGLYEQLIGQHKEPISQLFQEVPDKILHSFVKTEHPQTIAFLLTKMIPDQAAQLIQTMDEESQTDILIRVATLNNVKGDVVDEVREVIRSRLTSNAADEEEVDGAKCAADILNFVERANEDRILSEIEEMYADMAERIRNLMFTFEDCKRLDDKGIQVVLKEVPRDQLVLALKTASDDMKGLIFRNVSKRGAEMILEDLDALGPTKRKDVEKAQQAIVDIVRRLEAEGKVSVGGGGEEDAYI